jgi:hypothetical protein
MRYFVVFFIILVSTACSYSGSTSSYSQGSDVGGTGNVKYNHEILGGNKHLLTISASPGLLETEGSIVQRIHIFANKFATKKCPNLFGFVHDPNFDQTIAAGFMKRTKTYVFMCKKQ